MKYNESLLCENGSEPQMKTFFSTVAPGRRAYREHHHAECELSVFLSGSGEYSVNGTVYEFRPGDVFLFSGDEIHCITDIHSRFELLNIQFEPRLLWSDGGDTDLLRIFFARSSSFQNRIDRENPATQNIRNEIIAIEKELSQKKDGYRLIAKYKLFSVFVSLIRDYDYIDTSKRYTNYEKTVRPIEAALNFINENLDKPITLAQTARYAAMSQTYFSTVFKKLNGLSPWEYITIKRVEMAVKLLETTEMTKLEIAMRCGFNSPSNFYKAFFKITGKKPGDYQHRD